jgi:hypothetical protein
VIGKRRNKMIASTVVQGLYSLVDDEVAESHASVASHWSNINNSLWHQRYVHLKFQYLSL